MYKDFTNDEVNLVKNSSIVVNKESEHIEECLAFLNTIADPYGWLNINYGPEGDIWELDGNVLSHTQEFEEWLLEKGSTNFYPMSDGTEWSTWNTPQPNHTGVLIPGYVDINGDYAKQTFEVPHVNWEGASTTIRFYLVNEKGEPVNHAGDVVPWANRIYVGEPVNIELNLKVIRQIF